MPKPITWVARIAFGALLAMALLGALDPQERLAAVGFAPDEVSHAALSYGLTLLLLASFRRARPLAVAALMLCVGAALEILQSFDLFAGDGHWSDLKADALGIALAVLPLWIGRAQGRSASVFSQEDAHLEPVVAIRSDPTRGECEPHDDTPKEAARG